MKGKFRSINFKIWRIMTVTIVLFFGTILIVNITVIRNIKDEFIFKQLKEVSQSRRGYHENLPPRKIFADMPMVPPEMKQFKIKKNKDSFEIILDPFVRNFYRDKKGEEKTLNKIVNNIIKSKNKIVKGSFREGGMNIFYYVNLEESSENATVFFISIPENSYIEKELIFVICFLLVISFFISRIVAKKISKPIQKLELFAKEIAKRNWKVEVPKADNDEIGLLTQALEEMRDSLKMYEERDRQFLQSTSHDLKTPVMIIKGYAQSMIDGIIINSEKPGAEVIKAEAERLERKITQLLKLNVLSHSLEYNKSKEFIRVDRILKNLISKFQIVNSELKWIVDLKEMEIQGDSEAFLIAFENIIENQLRFAETTISVIMKKGQKNEIIISNDGPHFEVKDPNILFETYMKDKSGKFGLGLSIVKQIIKSHNASIEAYNTENGVEFKINLKK